MTIHLFSQQAALTKGRLVGLLQTDGNFFFHLRQSRLDVKITITFGSERFDYAKECVQPFLLSNDIKCSLFPDTKEKALKCYKNPHTRKRGVNLEVQGLASVEKFLTLIKETTEASHLPTLLVGDKLRDYLLFKEVMQIRNDLQGRFQSLDQSTIAAKLRVIEYKLKLQDVKPTAKKKSFESYLATAGLPSNSKRSFDGSSNFDLVDQTTGTTSNQLISQVNYSKLTSSKILGDFVAGIVDGDGSFQVGTHSNTGRNRRGFTILPMLTVTDLKTVDKSCVTLVKKVFNDETKGFQTPQENAVRVVIKRTKLLKDCVVPFFETKGLFFEEDALRFEIFKEALDLIGNDEIYQNKQKALAFVNKLYNSTVYPTENRKHSLEEYIEFINSHFRTLNPQ